MKTVSIRVPAYPPEVIPGFEIVNYLVTGYGSYPVVDEYKPGELEQAGEKWARRGCDAVSLTANAGKDETDEVGETWYTAMQAEWSEETGEWLPWAKV